MAHDPQRHAMLLQRRQLGDQLAASAGPVEARLRAGCAVLRELWQARPAPSKTSQWSPRNGPTWLRSGWPGIRPSYDPGLVAAGTRLLRELPSSTVRRVLLHGDFNPGNILSCGTGRWTAIDPNP